jgi:hypothetical protein
MMPVSQEDVRNAYRLILGRLPENEEVVQAHQKSHRSLAELRNTFLGSEEFRNQVGGEGPFSAYEPIPDVDVEANHSTIKSMMARTASYWAKVGESEPYWSVGASEKFLLSRWDETRDEFYKSGDQDKDFVVSLLRRIGRAPNDVKRLVEFGCGSGRCTVSLARTFANVSAIDISPIHLRLAEQSTRAEGLSNIEFLLVTPDHRAEETVRSMVLALGARPQPATCCPCDTSRGIPKLGNKRNCNCKSSNLQEGIFFP